MKEKNFVAVNYIDCKPFYKERFEELFGSRAKQIDTMPGFLDMLNQQMPLVASLANGAGRVLLLESYRISITVLYKQRFNHSP